MKVRQEMARVNRISVNVSENDDVRIVELGKKMDMAKTGVATMAMRIGLDAMEMAFDPNMKGLMVKANKTIDRVLEDEKKHKSSRGPGISKARELET
jgi:hypothetical protein